MLAGALLFGVPLIIHLLNRRRYRLKRWAAMDFLLAAYRRTRRRLRLENFLLLLLRCLIIILLAMAMAKPFVSSESAVAALTDARRDVVIALDNSYSMNYMLTPDESCFDLAKKKIGDLLARLDEGRGDTVTLILMGMAPEFLVPFHSSPSDALLRLERLRNPALQGADFSALAALLAGEVTANMEGRKEVYIFTDLQARTLGAQEGEERTSTAALLAQAVEKGAIIRFVDVGKPVPVPENYTVTGVETLEGYVTTDTPTSFVATVQNFGNKPLLHQDGEGGVASNLRGSFVLDGKPLEVRSMRVKPGQSATVECRLKVHDPGFHHISFRLERDDLPVDDEQWFSFEVRQSVPVLLVDGRFSDDLFQSASGELMWLMNPARMDGGDERGTIFDPTVVDFKSFNAGRVEIDRYACVFLVDVEGLSAETAESLLNYTRSGGSLVIFLGDQVDATAYNQRLFSDPVNRLLPARLGETMGDELGAEAVDYFKISVTDPRHPIFEVFNDPRYKPLLEVPIFKFIQVEDVEEGVQEVARFVDTLGRQHPAVLVKGMGPGLVVLFTTSVSPEWSLLPESPVTFLPLIHSLLYFLTSHDETLYNLTVGDVISRRVADFPERIALVDPSGSREAIMEAVEKRVFGRYLLPLSNAPLSDVGPYLLEVDFNLSDRNVREFYTANVDPAEGNLTRFDPDSLDALFPGCDLRVIEAAVETGTDGEEDAGQGEFWKPLLMALIALVGLELVLSWRFGSYS